MPELCMIANTVLDWVFNKHGFRLTTWNQPFLTLACKRVHVLKCQSIALPNCLIENRYGPIRVHNMMQGCSKTPACCKRLKDKLTVQAGRSYVSMATQLTHFVLIYWPITEYGRSQYLQPTWKHFMHQWVLLKLRWNAYLAISPTPSSS